ncbi:unnamed protein product [Paramecium primaurelia]|uniref:Uncharacterized protein n=1 Tax=Paramecium primaurelia TaxID=5886 RepID=A0A8S1QJ73_PARPR|nr:unnamed protein product [Paramecium primaurelia]
MNIEFKGMWSISMIQLNMLNGLSNFAYHYQLHSVAYFLAFCDMESLKIKSSRFFQSKKSMRIFVQ